MIRKSLVVIFVITLLITTFSTQVNAQVLDQSQTSIDGIEFLGCLTPDWQQFVPRGKNHQYIEVHIGCYYGESGPLIMTIEKPLGTVILSTSLNAVDIPSQHTDWTKFYINGALTIGETYYIVLTAPMGSEYAWSFGNGDPYNEGISSIGAIKDFCFRTFVDRSKSIDTEETIPINEFIEKNTDVSEQASKYFVFGIMDEMDSTPSYVDYEVELFSFIIGTGETHNFNAGEMIRLYAPKFIIDIGKLVIGICSDYGIIG